MRKEHLSLSLVNKNPRLERGLPKLKRGRTRVVGETNKDGVVVPQKRGRLGPKAESKASSGP